MTVGALIQSFEEILAMEIKRRQFLANALKQMRRKEYVIVNKIWFRRGGLPKVETAVKAMRKQGKAVVGMKIMSEGAFRDSDEKRDKSIKYVLESGCIDAMVVGFEKIEELNDFAANARKVPVPISPKQLIAYCPALEM